MVNLNPKSKMYLLFAVAFLQIWFWPWWFATVVMTGYVAVSSCLTAIAAAMWNVIAIIEHHSSFEYYMAQRRAAGQNK